MRWSELKAQIRRLLADTNAARYRWSEEQLVDFIGWSLDSLCAHTAIATATGFVCDGATSVFAVPDNAYESVSRSGAVYIDNGTTLEYLNPVRFNQRAKATKGYYLLPENTLHLLEVPGAGNELTIQYFAYYPHPTQDNDLILTPTWATAALCYRVAAHAFSPLGGKASNIRQWGQQPDTGNPEHNPLINQTDWYLELYEREIAKAPRQERENYYRTN